MFCLPQEAAERPAWVFFLVHSPDLPLCVSLLSSSSVLPLVSRRSKPNQTLLRTVEGGREGMKESVDCVFEIHIWSAARLLKTPTVCLRAAAM